jgi:ABC-type nitrate/sulfonate/bicarbonate transport system permease component
VSALRDRPWIVSVAFTVLVLCGWQAVTLSKMLPVYVYGPVQIMLALIDMAKSGVLAAQLGPSLFRALSGFVIGGTAGVVLGLLAGVSRTFRDLFDLPQSFTHSIPKIALFPAIAVVLGFSDSARIVVIALSCFYPAYLNALNGALGINPRLIWVAHNAGASRMRTFFQIVVPASLPRTLVGLRISLMVAFVLMVATEVVGFSNGLGAGLIVSYRNADYGAMYAGIAAIAACGLAASAILQVVSQRLCRDRAVIGIVT